MPPPGWVEPDPDGKSVTMDMSILGDGEYCPQNRDNLC